MKDKILQLCKRLNKFSLENLEILSEIPKSNLLPLLDEFVKEGKNWYLRVYVDKDGGVTLEDCADISDELSEALDNTEPDPIPQAYFLEVSSPGAERPLKKEADYERAINDYIHVSLYQQIEGKKAYEGTLVELTPDELTLEYMDKTRQRRIKIERKMIAQARLAIDFSKI